MKRSNLRSVASLSSSLLARGLWRGERCGLRSVQGFGSYVSFLKQKLDPQEEKKKKMFSVPLCQMSTNRHSVGEEGFFRISKGLFFFF